VLNVDFKLVLILVNPRRCIGLDFLQPSKNINSGLLIARRRAL